MFMFTDKGRVKLWEQMGKRGVFLAEDREMAEQVVEWFESEYGIRLSAAEIGTVQGETLKKQLEASRQYGADAAFIIKSIDGNQVVCDILEPPKPKNHRPDVVPIDVLFDESGTKADLSADSHMALNDAEVVIGVDLMSQDEFVVFGRDTLEDIVRGRVPHNVRLLKIGLDRETDDLERLLALVVEAKGHHDYEAS